MEEIERKLKEAIRKASRVVGNLYEMVVLAEELREQLLNNAIITQDPEIRLRLHFFRDFIRDYVGYTILEGVLSQ
jgi:hypothetical protein